MESEPFHRAPRGYDPDEVDAAIRERDDRLGRLEREAQQLARRVIETEERLQGLLRGAPPAAAAAVGRLEDIYAQARRQATRIRMKALEDAVQVADRVSELSKLRDELGSRVSELAGRAGIQMRVAEAAGSEAAAAKATDALYTGVLQIDVGPLTDFAQLSGLEDALGAIPGASEVSVKRFSQAMATVSVRFSEPVDVLGELQRRLRFGFDVTSARPDALVLSVTGQGEQRRAA